MHGTTKHTYLGVLLPTKILITAGICGNAGKAIPIPIGTPYLCPPKLIRAKN
jgi:hypothetical protein